MLISKFFMAGALCVSASASASIQGLYKTACESIEDQGLSLVRSANFEGTNATQAQVIYGDISCAQPAYTLSYLGPYSLDTFGAIDFTLSSMQLTAMDPRIAASFKQSKLCGIEDWVANKPQEVSGLDCSGQVMPSIGTVSYDLVREVETGIVFGLTTEENDGSTIDTRPAEFDTAVFIAVPVAAPASNN